MANDLSKYWRLSPDGQDRIIQAIPAPKPRQNRRCPKCRDADARECFVQRQPAIATLDTLRQCECDCHSH